MAPDFYFLLFSQKWTLVRNTSDCGNFVLLPPAVSLCRTAGSATKLCKKSCLRSKEGGGEVCGRVLRQSHTHSLSIDGVESALPPTTARTPLCQIRPEIFWVQLHLFPHLQHCGSSPSPEGWTCVVMLVLLLLGATFLLSCIDAQSVRGKCRGSICGGVLLRDGCYHQQLLELLKCGGKEVQRGGGWVPISGNERGAGEKYLVYNLKECLQQTSVLSGGVSSSGSEAQTWNFWILLTPNFSKLLPAPSSSSNLQLLLLCLFPRRHLADVMSGWTLQHS